MHIAGDICILNEKKHSTEKYYQSILQCLRLDSTTGRRNNNR